VQDPVSLVSDLKESAKLLQALSKINYKNLARLAKGTLLKLNKFTFLFYYSLYALWKIFNDKNNEMNALEICDAYKW